MRVFVKRGTNPSFLIRCNAQEIAARVATVEDVIDSLERAKATRGKRFPADQRRLLETLLEERRALLHPEEVK